MLIVYTEPTKKIKTLFHRMFFKLLQSIAKTTKNYALSLIQSKK